MTTLITADQMLRLIHALIIRKTCDFDRGVVMVMIMMVIREACDSFGSDDGGSKLCLR